MAYYSVVLTPRDGVTTDMTTYTRQLNDKLVIVNRYSDTALKYAIESTLRRILDDAWPQIRHLVKSVTVLKDTTPYASHTDVGWVLASAPSGTLDPSTVILMEG